MTGLSQERWGRYTRCKDSIEYISDALSHQQRVALVCILTDSEVVDIEWLAKEIAGLEGIEDDAEEVLIQLKHIHVPKLAESAFVKYDERSGAVRGTEKLDRLLHILDYSVEKLGS